MDRLKNKKQLGRFVLVGSGNTLLDFGLLFAFRAAGLPLVIANICSTTIAFIVSFFANKSFTFKSTTSNIGRELLLFVVVTLFGLWVLQSIVLWLVTPWLESTFPHTNSAVLIAKLVATAVSMVWNYVLYALVVFKKPTNFSEQ